MTFLTLFNRIGKQPVRYTRQNTVQVVLKRSDIEDLLESNQDEYIVPLELKFTNNGRSMQFEKREEIKQI